MNRILQHGLFSLLILIVALFMTATFADETVTIDLSSFHQSLAQTSQISGAKVKTGAQMNAQIRHAVSTPRSFSGEQKPNQVNLSAKFPLAHSLFFTDATLLGEFGGGVESRQYLSRDLGGHASREYRQVYFPSLRLGLEYTFFQRGRVAPYINSAILPTTSMTEKRYSTEAPIGQGLLFEYGGGVTVGLSNHLQSKFNSDWLVDLGVVKRMGHVGHLDLASTSIALGMRVSL